MQHIGRQATLAALGKTWKVSRWTRGVWADFLAWCKTRIPDPLEVASKHIDKFPPHLQDALVRHACDRASDYLSINSPSVQQCLASLEGSVHLLYLLLRAEQPDVDEDTALQIALEVGADRLQDAFDRAAGKSPPAKKQKAQAE